MNADELRRTTAAGITSPDGSAPTPAATRPAGMPVNWLGQQNAPRGNIRFIPGVDDFRTILPDGTVVNPTEYERTQGGENYRRYGDAAVAERQKIKDAADNELNEANIARTNKIEGAKLDLLAADSKRQGILAQGTLEQIRGSIAAQTAQTGLAERTLTAKIDSDTADRNQRADQFDATQRQQLLALQNADKTANRRLDIEDSHFSQQLAADKSARKLQAIMGISQSLAQLRI